MKKFYLILLILTTLLCLPQCRIESEYHENSTSISNDYSRKIVNKKEIPQIISLLGAKSNNFQFSLHSISNKSSGEALNGKIDTDFIVKTESDT